MIREYVHPRDDSKIGQKSIMFEIVFSDKTKAM